VCVCVYTSCVLHRIYSSPRQKYISAPLQTKTLSQEKGVTPLWAKYTLSYLSTVESNLHGLVQKQR